MTRNIKKILLNIRQEDMARLGRKRNSRYEFDFIPLMHDRNDLVYINNEYREKVLREIENELGLTNGSLDNYDVILKESIIVVQ